MSPENFVPITDALRLSPRHFDFPASGVLETGEVAGSPNNSKEIAMNDDDLTKYREPFKAVVLKHISESLGTEEWLRLRSMCVNQRRFVHPKDTADLDATPEALFDMACSEDGISVKETLVFPAFTPVVIGQLEGQPVYYVDGQGIYLWGQQPDSSSTLAFWLTHPAYPPSW